MLTGPPWPKSIVLLANFENGISRFAGAKGSDVETLANDA